MGRKTFSEDGVTRGLEHCVKLGAVRSFKKRDDGKWILDAYGVGWVAFTLAQAHAFCVGAAALRQARLQRISRGETAEP